MVRQAPPVTQHVTRSDLAELAADLAECLALAIVEGKRLGERKIPSDLPDRLANMAKPIQEALEHFHWEINVVLNQEPLLAQP